VSKDTGFNPLIGHLQKDRHLTFTDKDTVTCHLTAG